MKQEETKERMSQAHKKCYINGIGKYFKKGEKHPLSEEAMRKNWLKIIYPKFQKLLSKRSSSYLAIFFPKDVKNNKIEIPMFQNIFLDYDASEDFSKYLESIEIKEHPFNIIRRINNKLKKKTKLFPNEWLWKAEFKFSKKPKICKLVVEFQ
jgi:hypothetical protein